MSLDALRGFDMFWIVGGEGLVRGLNHAWPDGPFGMVYGQLVHKDWQGFAFYDLIFPLFIFIVGISTVFSVRRMIERDGRARTITRILIRSMWLYVLGLIVYGGISKGIEEVRWLGVLQRIAICYLVSSLLFCFLRPRALAAICVGLLVLYWGLTSFVPVRDFNLKTSRLQAVGLAPRSPETRTQFLSTVDVVRGRFDDGLNLPQHLDFMYLPGVKCDGAYDAEGLLSTLPAISTCLLGVFVGLLLANGTIPEQKKVLLLLGCGMAGVAAGFLWGLQFPVIKKIWTSSYVLVAGGFSCMLLAAFYQIIEIWRWRSWCVPFVWIGMNAITAYLAVNFLLVGLLAERIAGGPVKVALGSWGDLGVAVVEVALVFALVCFLYQRKLFLRL